MNAMKRLVLGIAVFVLALSGTAGVLAQSTPRLVQTEDGTLWVVTLTGRYRIVPQEMELEQLEDIPEQPASENGMLLEIDSASPPSAPPAAAQPRERATSGPITPESIAERIRQCIPGLQVEGSGEHVTIVAPGPPEEQAEIWQLQNLAVLESSEWQAHPSAVDVFISFPRMPFAGEDSDASAARRVIRNSILACFHSSP
jgi:hypothetical protein